MKSYPGITNPTTSAPRTDARPQSVELKKTSVAYLLAIFLGLLGAHHFYLGRPKFGRLYLCTGGLFGVGYVVDLIRVPWLVENANLEVRHPERRGTKYLGDAYLLWFPPFGLLGEAVVRPSLTVDSPTLCVTSNVMSPSLAFFFV